MEYRPLGKTGLTVSAIGFGSFASGSPWWGEQDDAAAVAAMREAFDLGITLFDTAPAYGHGRSEELLGEALAGHRQEIVIATKYGLYSDETGSRESVYIDCSRKRIIASVEESLRLLGTGYIDLLQQHWPDPVIPIEESMEAAMQLVQAGKVRFVGVSNFEVPLMQEALRHAPLSTLQPPYSLLRREVEAEILPFCLGQGLGVLIWGPMQHGLLTGKYTAERRPAPGDWRTTSTPELHFQGDGYARALRIVEVLKPLAAERGVTLAQLAIAWTLMHPAVSCALVGAKNPAQMRENAGGAGWQLTEHEMQRIEDILRTA